MSEWSLKTLFWNTTMLSDDSTTFPSQEHLTAKHPGLVSTVALSKKLSPGSNCNEAPLCFSVFSPRVVAIAVARYNFCARDTRELSMMQGDIIKVHTKMSNGWWKGAIDGRVGPGSQAQPHGLPGFS